MYYAVPSEDGGRASAAWVWQPLSRGRSPHKPRHPRGAGNKGGAAHMATEDFGVLFQGAIRLQGRAITVHGIMRVQGTEGEGHLIFPADILPELGRYYLLTLNDGTHMEIVIDDLKDGRALFTILG